MRVKHLVLGLVLSLAAGLAQEQPKPSTLSGEVVNELSGAPVVRANVTIEKADNRDPLRFGALTDEEGKFSVKGVPAGMYMVRAERIGFVSPRDPLALPRAPIEVKAGADKSGVKLQLTPTGSLAGRVLDAEGEPVEAVSVGAEDGASGTTGYGRTDEDGKFRIGGLPPGKYRVFAQPMNTHLPPEIRSDGTKEVFYAQTYYPGSTEEGGSSRITVRAGAETSGTDITLIRVPIVRLSGTVSGIPATKPRVALQVKTGRSAVGGQLKADDTFEIWRPDPGPATLSAFTVEEGRQMMASPVEFVIGATNIDGLEVRLIPPSDLLGQVIFADDDPAKQSKTPRPRSLLLIGTRDALGMRAFAQVAEDGSFRLQRVHPDRYVVRLEGGAPVYVKALRFGGAEGSGAAIDIRNGAAGASLDIVASTIFGSMAGKVVDLRGPVASVTVALVAEDPNSGFLPRMNVSDAEENYKFESVPPGNYSVVAIDDSDIQWVSKGKELDFYKDAVASVEVKAKEKLTKDLKARGQDR